MITTLALFLIDLGCIKKGDIIIRESRRRMNCELIDALGRALHISDSLANMANPEISFIDGSGNLLRVHFSHANCNSFFSVLVLQLLSDR